MLSQTDHGPYVSPDSINYIALARNLLEGNGYVTWNSKPVATWPPGYPVLLSLSSLSFFDPLDIAGAINAVILGLTTFVAARWLMKRIKSRFLVLWSCLAIILAIPLRDVSSSVWSEPIFILCVTLTLISMDKYLSTEKCSSLILAAAFTAFACLTRYVGITLILTCLLLLALQRRPTIMKKSKRIGLYLLISALPLGIWLLRNHLVLGTLTGNRSPADASLLENIRLVFNTLSRWWQNSPELIVIFQPASSLITGIILFALATLVVYIFVLWWQDADKSRDKNFVLVSGLFGFTYLVFMLWAATTTKMDPLNHRLLSPAYIPLLVPIVFIVDQLFVNCSKHDSLQHPIFINTAMSTLLIIVVILLSSWTLLAGDAVMKRIHAGTTIDNYGYRSIVWRESQTLQYLRGYRPTRIYSNGPHAIYINTDPPQSASYHYLPRNSTALAEYLDRQHMRLEGTYIVWFYRNYLTTRYDYDASHLIDLQGLETVAELADGVILRVIPRQEN